MEEDILQFINDFIPKNTYKVENNLETGADPRKIVTVFR